MPLIAAIGLHTATTWLIRRIAHILISRNAQIIIRHLVHIRMEGLKNLFIGIDMKLAVRKLHFV